MRRTPTPMEWTAERITAFWDFHSQYPSSYFAHQHGGALAKLLRRFVGPSALVLDYGCGPGFLLPHLLASGFRVAACDVSTASVAAAACRGGADERFVGAFLASDPGLRTLTPDAAVMTELVEHVDDATLDAVLATMRELLPPGRRLLVTTPNDEDLAAETVYCPASDVTFHRWQHVRSWREDMLNARLLQAGFELVGSGVTDFALHRSGLRPMLAAVRARIEMRKAPHLWSVVERRR
jgi:SAM-dependent methyltransferase